jgi:predicted dehydrogenase
MMNVTPEGRAADKANFDVTRRDFLKAGVAAGVVAGGGLGAFYFGYEKAIGAPVRVGVIGTGDEGGVLLGAVNPSFIEVRAIADIRPYNVHRAFYGDYSSEAALENRPGLMAKYGWKTWDEARRHVTVFGDYRELIQEAKTLGLEGVIIALPLHLHALAAIAAMNAGLHVITEKLMGHTVHECKEMARVAAKTGLHLATGHQRHYSILYANAMDIIQRGILGDLHYVRAQWHRSNLPGDINDNWQQPLPESAKPDDGLAAVLSKRLEDAQRQLAKADGSGVDLWRSRVAQAEAQIADEILDSGKTSAEKFGYHSPQVEGAGGKVVYQGPAIEELIRWRLWNRTGAGLMAELGSHQLDAASIFISAMHGGQKQHPLSVVAAATRPLYPPDRDVEDHVFCVLEFPAPGYDPKDPLGQHKKISVQYSALNGNGFGGYGEIVFGTKGTMILEKEQKLTVYSQAAAGATKVSGEKAGGPTMDTQASGAAPTASSITISGGGPAAETQASGPGRAGGISRGYVEELEHWAWCIRNPAPENRPRCYPKVALADAIIALTTNKAAREGCRIEFKEEWFDPDDDATPEGIAPAIPAAKTQKT